jgi:Squalene-hopene cyclase C-terminal domain
VARSLEPWRRSLKVDPVPALLATGDEPLGYFVRRDLLGEAVGPAGVLWEHPDARRILAAQNDDGSWSRAGRAKRSAVNVRLIETWRNFRFLIEQYEFTREHPRARKAAEYLFSCQTRDGDIRGMLANQYATYYTGAIMGLLIRAGYADDPRIERGFRWLLSMRQADGGWTIPILTRGLGRATLYRVTSRPATPIEPDRSKPFSHHWTGMVLRAFAAHPKYRRSPAARTAADLLKSRFFQPDSYASYRAASTWVRFDYPFWWNNLVAALDSLSQMGLSKDDASIKAALDWLRGHQGASGLWKASYAPGARQNSKTRTVQPWVTLAICRIFRRLASVRD